MKIVRRGMMIASFSGQEFAAAQRLVRVVPRREETHAPQQDEGPLELILTRGPTDSRNDVPR
jgi:hypothetical protein